MLGVMIKSLIFVGMSKITWEGNSPTQNSFSHIKLSGPVERAWVMGFENLGLN